MSESKKYRVFIGTYQGGEVRDIISEPMSYLEAYRKASEVRSYEPDCQVEILAVHMVFQ